MRREYGRVLDVVVENGELAVVIEACSLCQSDLGKYNPKYLLSPEQLKKYDIRWDGGKSNLEGIKKKMKGRFLEL
jgi:hypothetical protein